MKLKGFRNKVLAGLVGATCWVPLAHASSQLLPGIATGLALGAPTPPGLYSISIANYGWRGDQPNVGMYAPSWIVYSTPWTIAGGRFIIDTVTGVADVRVHGAKHYTAASNTLLDAQLKWDLGNGLSAGVQSGVWVPYKNNLTALGVTRDFFSFQELAAVTYEHNGWEFDATGVFGTGRHGTELGRNAAPSWVNLDLTAFKHVGNWELGAIAFGSHDLSSPVAGYQKNTQFALGALVGYKIGPTMLQIKLSRDVSEVGYGARETRLWLNWVVPISALFK
jgi:hypothetical protein